MKVVLCRWSSKVTLRIHNRAVILKYAGSSRPQATMRQVARTQDTARTRAVRYRYRLGDLLPLAGRRTRKI